MTMQCNTTMRFSLSNLLALGLCAGLLGAAAVPGLADLRQRMRSTLCANNLRACVQAWNVYAAVNADAWMHHWDRSQQATATVGGNNGYLQSPFTMWYYVKGEIPPGPAYMNGQGWWNYVEQRYGVSNGSYNWNYNKVPNNPQFHCPEMLGDSRFVYFEGVTAYSMPVYMKNYGTLESPQWSHYKDQDYFYPRTALFTHPATTLMIHDMVFYPTGGMLYPWSAAGFELIGQHAGRSNVSFCDGHVASTAETSLGAAFGEWAFRPYDAPPAP